MSPAIVFSICNTAVLPMWLLMILLPKWRVTQFLMRYKIIPLLLAIVYAIYIGLAIQTGGAMDFGSLASVMQLFTQEQAVLAGWVHYLAFDLLVGMWLIEKNKTVGLHALLMAPCLVGCFMFGPIGFLLFWIMATLKTKKA